MDLLRQYKEDGYFKASLYHLLAEKKYLETTQEITPSIFLKEMRMTCQERLKRLNGLEVENLVSHSGSEPKKVVLSFTPPIIVYQNFKPNDRIVAKFTVKNISNAPVFLYMVFKETNDFFIKPVGGELLSRLAPGIGVSFNVTFLPSKYTDYVHKVMFHTDVDEYVLPLLAIGPRPMFDFPDEIILPTTPLKVESFALIPVHNVSTVAAGFTLIVKCPFSVQPKSAYIQPGQKVELKIGFKTMHLGETVGKIIAQVETDEVFRIKLRGTTYLVNVELEKSIVRFLDTYNTMASQQTFKVTNKSSEVITYMCMKNDSVYNDFEDKIKLATIFYDVKDSESAKYRKLVQYDVLSSDEHERVFTRIFFDEIQALVADESLMFQDLHFSITPIKGKLWPNKTTEITITFAPKEIGDFKTIAYLDIDGIYDRVPLTIQGTSLPPYIHLHLETLNMGDVYINTTYNYEIVAINKGHINGVIVYKEIPPLFGSVISCAPELQCLRPGQKEIFTISFMNSNQGPFFEELNFVIRDTQVVRKVYLKGEVIYPTLKFSLPCLDYGNVSVGVSKTLQVEVINESVVNVVATVKISSDGPEVSSATLEDCQASQLTRFVMPSYPKEFSIQPSKMELGADSKIMLKVTLTANLIRKVETNLEIELEKSDSPPITLPIIYTARVPDITPAADIKLRACFLDFTYNYDIVISSNEFWGFFTIEEQEKDNTLKVDVAIKHGIIKPNTKLSLPVSITTSALGYQEYTIKMNLFSAPEPIPICKITGNGVRPIVTCMPMAVHWGQVKLLTKSQKILTLCNDSPVTVYFRATLLNRDGRWQIIPVEGQIEPESETEVTLNLYLSDAASYTNKAVIQLEKVKDILVPLSATGVGTSIVVGEERDRVNLGRHFIKLPVDCNVPIQNCGTRLHSLEWSEFFKAPKTKYVPTHFFNLEPRVFKLGAGEKTHIKITGMSSKVTTIREKWYLIGSVEGINKKELLLECQIVAEFVEPKVDLSTSHIDLRYDYGPYSEFYKLTDIMTIKNISKLPLDIDISIKPPFAIVQKKGTYKIGSEDQNMCCCICYNESDLNIQNMIAEAGPRTSKVFIDCLTLKPVEPLRKEPLHFFEDIHKIKMAFHLTHTVEERLEDQEVMKIQVIFDTTKHLTLKSKIYSDVMRIKFKGHKNKDAVKILGRINFPNVFVMTPKLDFQCIHNGSFESKVIRIHNSTPLMVCYRMKWKKCSIQTLPVVELPPINYDINKLNQMKLLEDEHAPIVKSVEDILSAATIVQLDEVKVTEESEINNGETEIYHSSVKIEPEKSSIMQATESQMELMYKMKVLKKITPMLDMRHERVFPWGYKFAKKSTEYSKVYINDICQLTPHRGMLKPEDCHDIHVIFRPKPNISVKAVLEVEVLGGPSEYVTVTGQSSDLKFKLNTQSLNFKIRSFHKQASELLIISNISQLPFNYSTYLNEPEFENDLHATIAELVPPEKNLDPEEEAEVSVVMSVGAVGFFHRVFLLEIGHQPHIPIETFGWGVIPQVYIALPRAHTKTQPELEYQAITTITTDYLEAVREIFRKGTTTEHVNSPQMEKCFEDPDLQGDWHLCSPWDDYPSIMDIELAIERSAVVRHIKNRPEILTMYSTTSKMVPIPGFQTTSYIIDYGVVITGNTVSCVVDIINYGPIQLKLAFSKNTHFSPWLRVKLCGKLNPGETGKLEVTFQPTSEYFRQLEENVEAFFYIEVPYGVTIPVHIKALCAVPYLKSNADIVDFGHVRCGDKIISSIPIRNVGKPTCVWYVTMKLKSHGPNPLIILDSSGKYEPGEGGWLSISFNPTMEMTYEAALIFRFHMNPHKLVIPVIGHGVLPHAHIIGPRVNFPPTLPWAETTEQFLGFTNPCPFPIELIATHIDEKWKEEEEIFQFLYKYYNKPEEILVPAVKPGAGLPSEIQSFYVMFKENLQKAIEEENASRTPTTTVTKKQAKSPKNAAKSAASKDKDKEASPKKFRTEAEIVAEQIKSMKEEGYDPLTECMQNMDNLLKENQSVEKCTTGLLLFLYGSPGEESIAKEMAYSLGMQLGLPTVSFDQCIVEALCVCDCPARTIVNNALNDTWDSMKKYIIKDDDAEESGDMFGDHADEFEIIQTKIELLANNKNIATPRSKVSDKKKVASTGGSNIAVVLGTNPNAFIQEELLLELLTELFKLEKFNQGFVMDSLTSVVLKNPSTVMTLTLKAKSTIINIHLVLCQSDFAKWAHEYEEAQREAELIEEQVTKIVVYGEEEIQNIVSQFEEMDGEEFENSNPELKALYIQHGLEKRRRKYYEKHGSHHYIASSRKDTKNPKDTSGIAMPVAPSESKKKLKKDDNKVKITTEYNNMQLRYNEYAKNVYEGLVNIAMNWIAEECDIGYPPVQLNGQVAGLAHKKNKKKSEIHLTVGESTSKINFEARGFPLTLVMHPCHQYKDAIVNMFVNCPFIKEILRKEEVFDVLKLPISRKEYTVLLPKTQPPVMEEESLQWYYLDETPLKKCECNQITDLHLLDDTTQDNVMHILSKWHCVCGKKVTSSQTSTSEMPSMSYDKMVGTEEDDLLPLPLAVVKSIPVHGGRLILQPGDLVRCKYAFSPTVEGNFSIKRHVEVAGWPDSRIEFTITGICDLPRLDNRPKKMFNNFVRRTLEDRVYKLTYLDDQKHFEFGPIFVGKNRIYEEEYIIQLKNSSLLTANVDIGFLDDNDVFKIDKNFIMLEPGCRGELTISAAPTVVGVHRVLLLFCIKDNPEIVTISIVCSGVIPLVEVLPLTKVIDYGRLLLYRREDDRFIIKNDSILPVMWKVRNPEDFVEDFIISKTAGIIPRNDNQVVPVTYIACNVGVLSQLPLIIDIYDELGRGEPQIVDTLYLTGECYDVQVECAYENPDEGFLNYGNVKVNSTVSRDMYLLNRGKYNIYYKLKKVKHFPEPSLLKSFEVITECGVVPPNLKLIAIEFECTPTTSINVNNVPAFICSLLDGSKDQVVVAKFPVCITIASFYNTFTLFPLGELNFHFIPVGSGVMREVVLNNTSKCPFNYEIIVPEKYRIDPNTVQLPPKGDKNKVLRAPPIKCGNFLIVNEDNLLAPGSSRTIQIQFLATGPIRFEETIHFIVSDTCPAEASGVPLRLVGIGAMPALDFWNLENTFREHLIVKNLTDYTVHEASPHCIFVEQSVTLHFICVTVNSTHCGAINLYNPGVVPCILTMKMHYQSNTDNRIFYVEKEEMQIDPLQHKRMGIYFSPKALEEYRAVLDVHLKLLHNQEQSYKLCLIGCGEIPRIRLMKPTPRQHKIAVLQFPVTCLGSMSNKDIRFKNICSIKSTVSFNIVQAPSERPVFWMSVNRKYDHLIISGTTAGTNEYTSMKMIVKPYEVANVQVSFNPLVKGRTNCNIKIKIQDNPYEYFTVLCEAEAFIEDVVLIGLEMISMEMDLDTLKDGSVSSASGDSRKKSKSAPMDKRKSKEYTKKLIAGPKGENLDTSVLKYYLDFGGCELCVSQRRSVVMLNNSEKVYKFKWEEAENIMIKPSVGYICPGEEKDIEIAFFSVQPVATKREMLSCNLTAVSDHAFTGDTKGATWDNRQKITLFEHNQDACLEERYESVIDEQPIARTNLIGFINIIIFYSAYTEYTKYSCNLKEEMKLKDTFIYQKRDFQFKIENVGNVPMKISWNFTFDDEYPVRIDKRSRAKELSHRTPAQSTGEDDNSMNNQSNRDDRSMAQDHREEESSKVTLFSGSDGRESVDTWFEADLPFSIEPSKECLKPRESKIFKVIFAPLEAFDFKVKLKSSIDNLDPYDQNITCKIAARSLIPYVHLDIEENDYITHRRKVTGGIVLPPHMQVIEFDVLGWGCFKKTFRVINPTSEAYEFHIQLCMPEKSKMFVPMHCNKMKGHVEAGTSTEVTFTFAPTAPGSCTSSIPAGAKSAQVSESDYNMKVYESQWRFMISKYNLTIPLLVVGIVREPNVEFNPNILVIRNSLVGFTTTNVIKLKNNENETLNFEFRGDTLCNDTGLQPLVIKPSEGVLLPQSEIPVTIYYTPIHDGGISFKIFCHITFMTKFLTLCVNALSLSIKPTVVYYIIGNDHLLLPDVVTNIHLEQTASTYLRTIPFKIRNDGSSTFRYEWKYTCANVKKYLTVDIEPRSGQIVPATEVECILYFNLKKVPVEAFPIALNIENGPEYHIFLYAEIEKPLYHFSCREYNFGKCIINAPDSTYKKNLAFTNDDKSIIFLNLTQADNISELYVDVPDPTVEPKQKVKIPMYFRPKTVKEFEFTLQFWVNSLCEEIITIRGEGVPLLVDLYEGCQKSFDLGPVRVGEKIMREINVMNHSKVPIDAQFIFKDINDSDPEDEMGSSAGTSVCLDPDGAATIPAEQGPGRVKALKIYRDEKQKQQTEIDKKNALASMRVVPARCVIQPHKKATLKIYFKPIAQIIMLSIQLNAKILEIIKPLVLLSGSATEMCFSFNYESLQFGHVRRRGCKMLKVMLSNKGDFGSEFFWQPLVSEEFTITPMKGYVAARSNVTFTITFRPHNYNPYVKLWASCNINNYKTLDIAMYAACVDAGVPQNQSLYMDCPVRDKNTEYVSVTNPTDENWFVISEMEGSISFETLREFHVEANSSFDIPIHFKPKTIGKHEGQVLFSPLGESALFVTLIGVALHPNANAEINIRVEAKKTHTERLPVYNISEHPESYIVTTELVSSVPDKFDGYYEIKYPDSVKTWGEAVATCVWTFVCFEPCQMELKVMFIDEKTREYQYYIIRVEVLPSQVVGTLKFVCRARESVQQEMTVANPLNEDSEFLVNCEKLQCAEKIKIAKHSERKITMTYSPLVVGEFEDYLTVDNYLVGAYVYSVEAICLPAKEKQLEFTTMMGSCIPVRLRVSNRSETNAVFTTTVDHPSLIVDREYSLPASEKGKFQCWFEPTELGVQNIKVRFDSAVAGEFVYNIKGIATEPKPQGPFEVKAGSFTVIKFKNVFVETKNFRISVDREEFYVKSNLEQIKSKKDIRVNVYLSEQPARGWAEPPTGCLSVEVADGEPRVLWTYFLQGIP